MINTSVSGKTTTVGVTAAGATVLVFVAGLFGLAIPTEVAVAVLGLVLFIVNLVVPAKSGTYVDFAVEGEDSIEISEDGDVIG